MYSIRVSTEEHADAKWVTVDDLNQYDWAPVDVTTVTFFCIISFLNIVLD